MKRNLIHKTALVFNALSIFLALQSCLKEGDKTILVNDPQDIPYITDYLPQDLLELFGEENVFFGDQPPVVDMEFKSIHEYIAVSTSLGGHADIGTISPITHYHKICQQYLQIADYLSFSMAEEENFCKEIFPVYLTGYGNNFTVYYHESPQIYGSPEYAVLFSGILTDNGVKDFRYGFKILKYNDPIDDGTYPVNSIFIFKDSDGLADTCHWYNNSLVNPQN